MSELLVGIGLVLAIEGLLFAAAPTAVKKMMLHALETPESTLRISGIISAIIGVVLIWLVRG